MSVTTAGAISPNDSGIYSDNTNGFQSQATAADFAELIKKLAGPEMLWKEQPAEAAAAETERDYTAVMGNLVPAKTEEEQ